MLKRLYIDNFRCFVNFELTLGPTGLFIGRNATGKSTLFEVLDRLRRFVAGVDDVRDAFPAESRTRWQFRYEQTFELEVARTDGTYIYHLQVEHNPDREQARVKHEHLSFNGNTLFLAERGEAHLYRDDGSEGSTVLVDWTRSGIAFVNVRHDNTLLVWFRNRLERFFVVQPNPWSMSDRSEREDPRPAKNLSNFASWFRHLTQEEPEALADLTKDLQELFPGHQALKLEQHGRIARLLKHVQRVELDTETRPVEFSFDDLSEGQRVLIALYTLLHVASRQDATVCVDEPANFVDLSEIQPWLMAMSDRVSERNAQALLVSHHPEVIDYLAGECGLLLQRVGGGPVRVSSFSPEPTRGLPASQLVARGWEDE